MDGAAAVGTSMQFGRQDHVHPSDTSRLALAGGTLSGPLILAADPGVALGAATKQYVDGKGGGTSVLVSDTPPTGVPDSTLWWESDTGQMYLLFNDGSSRQWVPVTIGQPGPVGPPCTVIIAGGLF